LLFGLRICCRHSLALRTTLDILWGRVQGNSKLTLGGRLAAVNFLLAGVGVTQVTRILLYQRSQKTGSVEKAVEKDAKDVADTAKGVAKDPERAVRKVEVEIK
jgi:hypothetical protein